jgi:hypothetical protein
VYLAGGRPVAEIDLPHCSSSGIDESGRPTLGQEACYIVLSRRHRTNADVAGSADTRVGAVGSPIDVGRRPTSRRARTPNVSSRVPYAITRPTHSSTVTVEDDSPTRRGADHGTAAILDASRVRRPASDSSIPGSGTSLVVGRNILASGLKQQAQANKNWHKWSQRQLPVAQWFWSCQDHGCHVAERFPLSGLRDPWCNVTARRQANPPGSVRTIERDISGCI